jgi:hypothetical protein
METILNLVWLAITLATIWLWRFRWAVSRRNPRNSFHVEVTAIVCALALLFPVISLTDDLHPETAVVDSASGKRNHCLLNARGTRADNPRPALHPHSIVAVLPRIPNRLDRVASGITSQLRIVHLMAFGAAYLGRSPPSRLSV